MNKLRKIFDPLILLTLFSFIFAVLVKIFSNPTMLNWLFFGVTAVGFFLIIYSKFPQIKKGDLFSFGIKYLKGKSLYLYITGWLMILLGLIFLIYLKK